MKGFPVLLAALLVSGALAIAQVYPPGYMQPNGTTMGQVYTVPPVGAVPGTIYAPTVSAVPGSSYYPMVSSAPSYYYYPMTGAMPGSMCYPMTSAMPGSAYYPTTGAMPGSAYYPTTSAMPGSAYYPTTSAMPGSAYYPMVSAVPGASYFPTTSTMQMTGAVISPICPSGPISRDSACVLNQLALLRGDVNALALVSQGQSLVSRMNQLMSQEQIFRQALAANPNLPNAQMTALQLSAEAQALNRDIAAFNRQLSMVPAEQRPFMASALSTFDVANWQPTVQAFMTYQAQLPAAMTTYQPAFAQNPWLQPWFTSYQASLAPLSQTQQVFASASWWNQPMVLGSAEVFPSGTMIGAQPSGMIPMTAQPYATVSMLPNGAVVYIPASVAATAGFMGATSYLVGMAPYGATPYVVGAVPSTTGTVTVGASTTTTAISTTPPPATTTTGENY